MTHRKRRAPKIKWSLFATFTSMTVVIIILLWALQLLLLNIVYSWTTRSRMQSLIYEIAYEASAEDFAERAVAYAEGGDTAMMIYRVEGDHFTLRAEYEQKGCVTHLLDSADLRTLYDLTVSSSGVFQETLNTALGEGHFSAEQQSGRLFSSFVAKTGEGVTYFILLDTAILPLRHMFYLMQNQLAVVSLILITVSAGVAFLISRHIANPIERISGKAQKMAGGELALDFSERSYREIEDLSQILNQTADELSKIERMQKELIANISHDLRTPLTMIVGYAEVMRDIDGENTPENVQVIIDEATRLSSLVNDLLEISRMQNGSAVRRDETFDLVDVTKQTLERYRHLKENGGFTFTLLADESAPVYADRGKIQQVLCNLINNAINYSEEDKRIHVSVRNTTYGVRLEVKDHGIGIAPENLEHVWQRYYRGDKNHRRSTVGSGLGLSIVREILDLHHARYGVSSTEGEGSNFWFELSRECDILSPERI